MCTLSIFRIAEPAQKSTGVERKEVTASRVVITMNRDELRSRDEDEQLRCVELGNRQLVYPVDKQAGGTWFAANNQGVVGALLNRYQDTEQYLKAVQQSVPPVWHSRGELLPALLGETDECIQAPTGQPFFSIEHKLRERLNLLASSKENTELHTYRPFDLLLINTEQALKLSWTGYNLASKSISLQRPYFITSSSVDFTVVAAKRQQAFVDFYTKNEQLGLTERAIRTGLHHLTFDNDPSASILMSRSNTHTKSICQLSLNEAHVKLSYFSESTLYGAGTAVKQAVLHLRGPAKENMPIS